MRLCLSTALPGHHQRTHGLRVFVANLDHDESSESPPAPIAIINPEITPVGSAVEEDWEGCLSIPDIRGRVPRAVEIKLRAWSRDGERLDLTARHYAARVIQHETDHLDGILFFDRMRSFDSLTNFVMLNTGRPSAQVVEHFGRHRILVAGPVPGYEHYIRVSLGTAAEMNEFWRVWDLMPGGHMHT